MKSLIENQILSDIEKARSGVYADTPENRRLHRVGRKYGSENSKESEEKGKSDKQTPEERLKAINKVKAAIDEGKLKLPPEEVKQLESEKKLVEKKLEAKERREYSKKMDKHTEEVIDNDIKEMIEEARSGKRPKEYWDHMRQSFKNTMENSLAKKKDKERARKTLDALDEALKGDEKKEEADEKSSKKEKGKEEREYRKKMDKRTKEVNSSEVVVAEAKTALKEAFGKLSYRDEGGDEIVAEAGEGGANEQLGDFGLLIDKKTGKVTLYDAVDGDDIMTGFPTNKAFIRQMKEKMNFKN